MVFVQDFLLRLFYLLLSLFFLAAPASQAAGAPGRTTLLPRAQEKVSKVTDSSRQQRDSLQILLLRYTLGVHHTNLANRRLQPTPFRRVATLSQVAVKSRQIRSDQLVMTQDLIFHMLDVRREGITMAARQLKDQGLISYVRGTITMRDRQGRETAVCECYQVVKRQYDRLLSLPSS